MTISMPMCKLAGFFDSFLLDKVKPPAFWAATAAFQWALQIVVIAQLLILRDSWHLRCAGINSFFAGLAGSLPNTTFAQNNGVLALTRCASRSAGYACGMWLFLFGVLAKVRSLCVTSCAATPALLVYHLPSP